jgi:hypothetical protein
MLNLDTKLIDLAKKIIEDESTKEQEDIDKKALALAQKMYVIWHKNEPVNSWLYRTNK